MFTFFIIIRLERKVEEVQQILNLRRFIRQDLEIFLLGERNVKLAEIFQRRQLHPV